MKLFKKILNISLIVWGINRTLNALFDGKRSFFESFINPQDMIVDFAMNFLTTAVIMIFFHLLDKKLSWEKEGKIKLTIGILGALILSAPLFFIIRAIRLMLIFKTLNVLDFFFKGLLIDYIISMIFTLAIVFFYLMVGFLKALQEKRVNEQKIIAGTATAQFAALKNQLDPHFLFNSLNVLTSLIEENTIAAQKFTTSLSKVYRYVLEQKNKDVVSIEEELKFAKTYMSLLQMRFENSIFLELPETIQRIKIYEEKGFLYVTNNLQPKAILKTESGVGLTNISQRYDMLTDRKFSVEKTEDEFVAKLPILTKNHTITGFISQ